jgi:hypothetical protein
MPARPALFQDKMARMMPYALMVIALLLAPRAHACTLCHTDIGRQVRAGVFADDFWQNLGITVLPIALVGGVAVQIRRGGSRR